MTCSKQQKGAFKQTEDNREEVEEWSSEVEDLSTVPPLFSPKRRLNKLRNAFFCYNRDHWKIQIQIQSTSLGYIFRAST